jgi:hypothetical protein
LTKLIKKQRSGERIGRQLLAGKIMLPFAVNNKKAKSVIKEAKKEIDKQKLEDTSSDSDNEIIIKALESDPEDETPKPKPNPAPVNNIFGPALYPRPDMDPRPSVEMAD